MQRRVERTLFRQQHVIGHGFDRLGDGVAASSSNVRRINKEGMSENYRRAKFYRLMAKGRRKPAVETSKWDKLAEAIEQILRPAEPEGGS